MAKRGKLIVIDGTDGSGKATQIKLLRSRLMKEGYTVKLLDFPEYYKNFFGKFIGHCLSEQYYNWINVHPKIASISYAADRWESSPKIKEWLGKGYIVLANRYATANQIHQGGKIANAKKRENFMRWLEEMEYKVFKIPRPNTVFYLHVPMKIILRLIKERNKNNHRAYVGKRKDIVEGNIPYLTNSHKTALWLSQTQKGWVKIECAKGDVIKTREEIHREIYQNVRKILK